MAESTSNAPEHRAMDELPRHVDHKDANDHSTRKK